MSVTTRSFALRLSLAAAAAFPGLTATAQTTGPLAQRAYVKASNTGLRDGFGEVAIWGDTMVIGAPGESSTHGGIDANEGNDSAPDAGAAYVYERSGTTWTRTTYLKAVDADANDRFGSALAISGDTIVVGALGEASTATGVNGNPYNNDGSTTGAAYVFVRQGATWRRQAYLKTPESPDLNAFGAAVAIDGDTLVATAPGWNFHRGAAYVFVRNQGTWVQESRLLAFPRDVGDAFGSSVAISGNTIVIGAPHEDSDAVGIDGNRFSNHAHSAGAVYIFLRRAGVWTREAYVKASNSEFGDMFGGSVDIDGDTVVVGAREEDSGSTVINANAFSNAAPDAGAAYVFVRDGVTWTQQSYLKAPNTERGDSFGWRVAVEGDRVVASAPGEESGAVGIDGDQGDNSAFWAGAAYGFQREGTTWQHGPYLKASNAEAYDRVRSVAISGDTIVIGADDEDSNAKGVNWLQANNDVSGSGAAYVFAPGPGIPFCPSLPNATGSAAELRTSGEPDRGLTLTSYPVPDTHGQFFFSSSAGAGVPFGDGLLCVGGMVVRLPPVPAPLAAPRTAIFEFDYGAPYANALSGTLYFQHWFRSGLATGTGFNTSNGLEVTF